MGTSSPHIFIQVRLIFCETIAGSLPAIAGSDLRTYWKFLRVRQSVPRLLSELVLWHAALCGLGHALYLRRRIYKERKAPRLPKPSNAGAQMEPWGHGPKTEAGQPGLLILANSQALPFQGGVVDLLPRISAREAE